MPGGVTAEDLYLFRWIDHVRLSPDGRFAAYQVGWAGEQARENAGRINVLALPAGEPLEIPSPSRRDQAPEWSPDSSRLVFQGRVGGRDQLFLAGRTGEAQQLTFLDDGAAAARWSPDGSLIAFLGTVVDDPEAVIDDPRPPESEHQARRPPVARVARRLDYKHDGRGYADGREQHLFVVAAGGGEPRQLTSGAWSVEGFDWSPHSDGLLVAGDPEPDADLRFGINIYVVDLEGRRRLLLADRELGSPTWSPRGDLVAFLAPLEPGAGAHSRVWVMPAEGGEPRCLTSGFDANAAGSVIADMRAGHGGRLAWSGGGDRVLFLSSGPGTVALQAVDLEGRVEELIAAPRRCLFDFDLAGARIAFAATDAADPGQLYLLENGQERRLTDLNPWLRDRKLAVPEEHIFRAEDGLEIQGWLMKPPTAGPEDRLPLVMQIHGGPHGQYGWAFFHEFQILADRGFLVFYTNPRGSDGKSEEFKKACVLDWGGRDYGDLMSALDQLLEHEDLVDSERLGVGGGSYGGFMTNWIVGHTDRFKAAVAMRSISNLVSEYAQHDIVLWGQRELGQPPWPDPDELWQRSPIRYVRNIRTPLLLTHGEMDLRCAISQAEELFGALRLLGREVELVRFPGESHDLSRGGRPDRRVERLERIAGWYERHLLAAQPQPVGAALEARG